MPAKCSENFPKLENRKYAFAKKYLRVRILNGMNTDIVIYASINIEKDRSSRIPWGERVRL